VLVDLVCEAYGKNGGGGGGGGTAQSFTVLKSLSLGKCQGFIKFSHPRRDAGRLREKTSTTGATELMEWVENICRFAISEITKQYGMWRGCLSDISSGVPR
jgi:hypothetical protein